MYDIRPDAIRAARKQQTTNLPSWKLSRQKAASFLGVMRLLLALSGHWVEIGHVCFGLIVLKNWADCVEKVVGFGG